MSDATQRVGLFGGTFDPPHNAHIVAALAARFQLQLDHVLMVVARDPWQKRDRVEADENARMEMVRLACEGIDGLVPCAVELERAGPTYTIDTVEALRREHPNLVLILGADAVTNLGSWHRADELAAMVSVAALPRWSDDGAAIAPVPPSERWQVTEVAMPRLDITSTALRLACGFGIPIDGFAPAAVVRYMRAHRLYTRS